MSYFIPMCPICGEFEVGTFHGSDQFCSVECEDKNVELYDDQQEYSEDEPSLFDPIPSDNYYGALL